MAYALPTNKLNVTLKTPWSSVSSHPGESAGYTGKIKCSRLCTKMIAITANPRRASTTSIRGFFFTSCSILLVE